ncbi:MAG: STAS domain-containing protein [Desulfobacterales bacterium]|jgi:anti-sigma B factor antagonist/stage II sporulation protein AA (anti-sigma F factor antagonist)
MKIETSEKDGIVSFTFAGRLDAVTSEATEKEIMQAITPKGRFLYDLTALEYISSAGLRVLLASSKQIQRTEGRFVMCAPNENVRHILEISGFASIFPMADTLEEGRRHLTD